MWPHILIIVWLAVLFFVFDRLEEVHSTEIVLGKETVCVHWLFAVLSVLPLIYFAATRDYYFADTTAYAKDFFRLPTTLADIGPYLDEHAKDRGFTILSIIIKWLVRSNVRAYFFIIAAIQALALAMIYRKYSANYVMSFFIFVASTDYISWMQNGIRQFTAVAVIFGTSGYLFQKKYIRFLLCVLLASTFHLSALIMVPIMVIARGVPWRFRTILIITVTLVAIIYISKTTSWLDETLAGTQYENVVTEWKAGGDDGTNPLRVLVYSVPAILSFIGLGKIREEDDPFLDLICNMGIITMLLYVISMFTSGIFIGRLPIYCSLYANGILLPWEIENLFSKESEKITKIAMVVLFLGFYYYQMHVSWGVI